MKVNLPTSWINRREPVKRSELYGYPALGYHSDMVISKSRGQATVEYVFILAVAVLLSFEVTRRFSTFFQDQLGRVGHVLSSHLIVGVCPTECFYAGYYNGYKP